MKKETLIESKILCKFSFFKATAKKIHNFILDTLFPIKCLGCSRENFWLCDECLSRITVKDNQNCPYCEKKVTPGGRTCFSCRRNFCLDALVCAVPYQNRLVAKSIHYYKYRFALELAIPLGKILKKAYWQSGLPIPDIITSVPLHRKRLRWRGFNQSNFLARQTAFDLTPGFEIPVFEDILYRRKYSRPQMKIKDYAGRRKNIKGAFEFNQNYTGIDRKNNDFQKFLLPGKTVLIIDDIATTGATLFECAKVLKQNGAKEVYAAVLARQELNQ